MTMKRIQREISDIKKEDLGSIVLEPTDNLQVWRGVIPGPEGSVYEGGVFQVEIVLPNDYPFVLVIVFQFHHVLIVRNISGLQHPKSCSRRGECISLFTDNGVTNLFSIYHMNVRSIFNTLQVRSKVFKFSSLGH